VTEFLTVVDVAERYGVSPRTVQRWIRAGALTAIELPGGQKRIRQVDVTTFEQGRQIGSDGHRLSSLSLVKGGS
jgi:excisionase family DNA binding protein